MLLPISPRQIVVDTDGNLYVSLTGGAPVPVSVAIEIPGVSEKRLDEYAAMAYKLIAREHTARSLAVDLVMDGVRLETCTAIEALEINDGRSYRE